MQPLACALPVFWTSKLSLISTGATIVCILRISLDLLKEATASSNAFSKCGLFLGKIAPKIERIIRYSCFMSHDALIFPMWLVIFPQKTYCCCCCSYYWRLIRENAFTVLRTQNHSRLFLVHGSPIIRSYTHSVHTVFSTICWMITSQLDSAHCALWIVFRQISQFFTFFRGNFCSF